MTTNTDLKELRALGYNAPDYMAAMMACSPDCFKLLTPDGKIAYMSHNGRCVMEIDNLDDVLHQPWSALWPSEHKPLIEGAVTAAQDGKIAHFVAECPTAKGSPGRWDVTVMGIFSVTNALIEIMAISRETDDPCRGLVVT
ncbi:MAG: PAS domain-containing protein [Tateyamaria sp.]